MNTDDPRLTAFALGETDDETERAEIEALLRRDPAAAAAVSEIAALAAALADALAAEAAAPMRLRAGQRLEVIARAARRPGLLRRSVANPRLRAAAALAIITALAIFFFPARRGSSAIACDVVMVPDGGRLEALDETGRPAGPCPLEHTDVAAEISGHFSRVTVRQTFRNTYQRKIEAVYTFPLSHRGAVDRMTMTIGDRVVAGAVKERDEARRTYEAARAQGHVASLLEQERPNVFTQSVANIEPGATVEIEISYVEVLESADGAYTFDFPMVVGPRYVPGALPAASASVPDELAERGGAVLLGPAQLTIGAAGDLSKRGSLQPGRLEALLSAARPIEYPGDRWWGAGDATGGAGQAQLWYRFEAAYCDGSREPGELYADGTGQINGRWFYTDPAVADGMGTGFEAGTDQVPDGSRITPLPVRPPTRAGHDVSLAVSIDTGGPAIRDLAAPLHRIDRTDDGPSRVTVALARADEIPNRDFVLSWRTAGDSIQEALLTHAGPGHEGGFFTLILEPPGRADAAAVQPRELVFVMDVSGSMQGFPIEKSKAVMRRAIDAMRDADTFNVVTFSGRTAVLWDRPRPATAENRAAARAFVESQQGGGGTEMMQAIGTALVQRGIGGDEGGLPMRIVIFLTDGLVGNDQAIIQAIRDNARTTRVFSFGIGNSVNRFLIDGMADAGRGAAEFVLLESDADAAVERLTRRFQTPVLADIRLEFGPGLAVTDVIPDPASVPDLFDVEPLVVHGRSIGPGRGTFAVSGRTGAGPWRREVELDLPASRPEHDVLATLWARAKVDSIVKRDLAAAQQGTFPAELRREVVALGEEYSIMTPFTSFVAVEKSRVTIGGEPVLVSVPVELPQGVAWEGIFGEAAQGAAALATARSIMPHNVQGAMTYPPQWGSMGLRASGAGGQGHRFYDTMDPVRSPGSGEERMLGQVAGVLDLGGGADRAGLVGYIAPREGAQPRVPLAGDIPLLGEAFRYDFQSDRNLAAVDPSNTAGLEAPRPQPLAAPAGALSDSSLVVTDLLGTWAGASGGELAAAVEALVERGPGSIEYAEGRLVVSASASGHAALRDALAGVRSALGSAENAGAPLRAYDLRRLVACGEVSGTSRAAVVAGFAGFITDTFGERARVVPFGAAILVRAAPEVHEAVSNLLDGVLSNLGLGGSEQSVAAVLTRKRLERALDSRLLPLATAGGFPETLDAGYVGPKPPGTAWSGGGVLLSIRLEPLNDAAVASVSALGIDIQARDAAGSFVVAAVPPGRLDELALLPAVRRVEPANPQRPR